jgi:DNA invertase Pin-like site-specific DNA recombinase
MGPFSYSGGMAKQKNTRPLALAYVRVSTADQAEHGASLAAQRHALIAEGERRGWDVEVVADEGVSAKTLNRPAMQDALTRLDAGQADYLMSIRLDRVSRSVADFAGLLDRAGKKGWGLVLLSPNIDTSDPAGRFTSNVLASAAQYERELIGMRTREGMMQRKAEGVRLGRPVMLSAETFAYIVTSHTAGKSMNKIAAELNANGVPTATGKGKWHAATIKQVLTSQNAAALAA